MTAADVIRMLLEMDQQVVHPRPSTPGRAAKLVATLCEHAEGSLRDPGLLGDYGEISFGATTRRAPRDLDQPTLALAEENDRLRVELAEARDHLAAWDRKADHGCIGMPCRTCEA